MWRRNVWCHACVTSVITIYHRLLLMKMWVATLLSGAVRVFQLYQICLYLIMIVCLSIQIVFTKLIYNETGVIFYFSSNTDGPCNVKRFIITTLATTYSVLEFYPQLSTWRQTVIHSRATIICRVRSTLWQTWLPFPVCLKRRSHRSDCYSMPIQVHKLVHVIW